MLVKKIGLIAVITGLVVLIWRLLVKKNATIAPAQVAASTNTDTQVTNIVTTPAKVYNNFTRSSHTSAGTIPAGKSFIKITNVGESEGQLDVGNGNTPLGVGHSWEFSPATNNIIQLSAAISFDATGTTFLVETQQPLS